MWNVISCDLTPYFVVWRENPEVNMYEIRILDEQCHQLSDPQFTPEIFLQSALRLKLQEAYKIACKNLCVFSKG